jgi:hypothetical protein
VVPFSLPLLMFAQTDPYRGRCLPELENRLDACAAGNQEVWHYTFREKSKTNYVRSWPYKSRERAQRALESDRKLCQSVDRYFDHTDCQTSYGEVFCAACESQDIAREWTQTDAGHSLLQQAERWDGLVIGALRDVQAAERQGFTTPDRAFGGVFREYAGNLRSAQERARALESLLWRTGRVSEEVARWIEQFSNALALTESSQRSFQSAVTSHSPVQAPDRTAAPNVPIMISLTDRCVAAIPCWTRVCDEAVDALFARAKNASGAELECLKEWRRFHNCLGVYAHDSNPSPPPVCVRPTCVAP